MLLTTRATAETPPTYPTYRLDFAADRTLALCDDPGSFRGILLNWVPQSWFVSPYERTAKVRIRRAPNGDKTVDISIQDADGTTLTDTHRLHPAATECFKVLYSAAFDTAKTLETLDSPAAPAPAAPSLRGPVATLEEPLREPPLRVPPQEDPWREFPKPAPPKEEPRRGLLGAGAIVGYGLTPDWAVGPRVFGGFVPAERFPRFSVELDAAWLSNAGVRPSQFTIIDVDAVPFSLTACYLPSLFRLCAGLTGGLLRTALTDVERPRVSLQGFMSTTVRAGVELMLKWPVSVRADVDGAWNFLQPTTRGSFQPLWSPTMFSVGFTAAAVVSFH